MGKPWRPSVPTKDVEALNREADDRLGRLTGRPMYYDRQGKPIGLGDWVEAFNDMDYRRVAHTVVGHVEVSTVWMGMDHGVLDEGPLIFETMCFAWVGGERATDDGDMERYRSEAEALAGHERIVAALRKRVVNS